MMMKFPTSLLFQLILLWAPAPLLVKSNVFFDNTAFLGLVDHLKADAHEFAREVERLYAGRCDLETINSCSYANYGECQGYPNEVCLGGPNYQIDQCTTSEASSSSCAALWDLSTSTVRIHQDDAIGRDGNPTDPKLIESICFTRFLDDWFVQKRQADKSYWDSLGVEPRSMYFGSHNGAFRIYPARQSEQCGTYDPTVRPWYISGSSGPKNIVLILDVSGSMAGRRFSLLKTAAKRVVSTLTVSDRVLIVPFSDTATPITDNGGFLFTATADNKDLLLQRIDRLVADGGTNFYEGFSKAFDTLDASIARERTTSCNTAILFLTDGENTVGPDLEQVTNLVHTRLPAISDALGKQVLLFTYSVSDDNQVHEYPSQLACSVDLGVWSKISDDDDIIDALTSYYRLFALGLGSDVNADFASWVQPYQFKTGNVWGTTVSVPVYDRTKTPHLFLGVVGVDVSLDAIDAALLIGDGSSTNAGQSSVRAEELRAASIERVVEQSDASCPVELDLTPCEMEAYRDLSAPDGEGLCGVNCTNDQVAQVQEEACPTISDYPKSIFRQEDSSSNHISSRKRYEERVCCVIGGGESLDVCWDNSNEDGGLSVGAIVGIAVGALALLVLLIVLALYFVKQQKQKQLKPVEAAVIVTPEYDKEDLEAISPQELMAKAQATAPSEDEQ